MKRRATFLCYKLIWLNSLIEDIFICNAKGYYIKYFELMDDTKEYYIRNSQVILHLKSDLNTISNPNFINSSLLINYEASLKLVGLILTRAI